MPELPEVETLRRDLVGSLRGLTILSTTLGRLRSVRRYDDPQRFIDETEGATFLGFDRHGKYLLARLSGERTLVIHLRMSGQLRLAPSADEPVAAHTHVRFLLSNGSELRFVDPRTFGEMWVTTNEAPELRHLGRDALDILDDRAGFAAVLAGRQMALKGALLDQSWIAGVGSIYADEACFVARVRPTRTAGSLSRAETERLRAALRLVLDEGIAARGSTLGDGQYVDLWGRGGSYGDAHRVHARSGSPCPACRATLVRTVVAQRSAVYCPTCQR